MVIDFIEVTPYGANQSPRLINVHYIIEVQRVDLERTVLSVSDGAHAVQHIKVEETYRDIYNMLHDVAFFRNEAQAALNYKDWLDEIGAKKCPECRGKGSIGQFDGEDTEYDLCERCGGLCYLPNPDEFPEYWAEEA